MIIWSSISLDQDSDDRGTVAEYSSHPRPLPQHHQGLQQTQGQTKEGGALSLVYLTHYNVQPVHEFKQVRVIRNDFSLILGAGSVGQNKENQYYRKAAFSAVIFKPCTDGTQGPAGQSNLLIVCYQQNIYYPYQSFIYQYKFNY